MKKLLTVAFALLAVVSARAQVDGDGYYRVRNYGTKRYCYVYDNTGSINALAFTADMAAIQLWKGEERILDDPASVIYIKRTGTSADGTALYDLQAQGTGVKSLIGYSVQLYESTSGTYKGLYRVYAEGYYLCDNETSATDDGFLGTDRKGDYRYWEIFPLDDDARYLGLTPTVTAAGKMYKPYFVDFGYSFHDSGLTAWYVSAVHEHGVVMTKVTDSAVPAQVPAVIECASEKVQKNRLSVTYLTDRSKYTENCLKGVFFNNSDRPKSKDARTAYDAATMRVLGTDSDGNLAYVKSNEKYLAANESYLPVSAGADAVLRVFFSEEEYTAYETSLAVGEIAADGAEPEIYTLTGKRLSGTVESLQPGIYIVNRRKLIVR